MVVRDLYDRDFFEWTRSNAALLRARRFDQVDVEHLAEEIEDMGKSERRELFSRLRVLLLHLLKWQVQPERRGPSWKGTIRAQRVEIRSLLRDAPSLRRSLAESLPELYGDAASGAADETDLPRSSFPVNCPFRLDQILDEEFFPG